ncbi:MAG TPA: reverse transcriptase family protein [Dongiaceae bacterium]|nr:reverse transcriptase family protein [Dongiaceae bacterium]
MGSSTTRYAVNQCALYKVTSPSQLADRLRISLSDLEAIASRKDNYNVFSKTINGKVRTVEEPKLKLQQLHKRINDLLARIATPNYLHSAIKGRSYLTNARAHLGSEPLIKVDVRSFFRSVKKVSVFKFFQKTMHCADDVAGLLANLLTVEGHLPTGSSSSPIISYYAHKEMFDEVEALAKKHNLEMTCYVDDMAISGQHASRAVLFKARAIIAKHGLKSHKAHYFSAKKPKVITGVVATKAGYRLPNRRHQKIMEGFQAFRAADTVEAKLFVLRALISRLHEAASIDPAWSPRAKALLAERRTLEAKASQL